MVASSPLLRPASISASRRKWAIGAAAAAALAVSAWAFRSDLPFISTPSAGNTTTASAQGFAPDAGDSATTDAATAFAAVAGHGADAGHGARSASVGGDDAAEDAQIFDSLWLADVPDDALDPGNYDYVAASYSSAPGAPPPPYAPVVYYPPYALPPTPVAYYAPSPWRFGFGLSMGLGVGWWATHYYYAPVFVGPAFRPGFAWARPLPGAIVARPTIGAAPGFAARPLADSAVTPLAARAAPPSSPQSAARVPSTGSAHALPVAGMTASARPAIANAQQRAAMPRNAQVAQARREQVHEQQLARQQARREQMRAQQQARIEAKQDQLAQRRTAERENHPRAKPKHH
jgi:hypothetical protein